mgnify:CR=1 FL=1
MIKIPKLLRALMTSSGRTAYTFDWPRINEPPEIRLDLATGSLGILRFGDHIDAARPLGRPGDYHRHQGKGCGLLYLERGVYLEFNDRRELSFVTFHLSQSPASSSSRFIGRPLHLSDGAVVSFENSSDDISRLFGKSIEAAKDEDGMMLTHQVHGFLLDVYFTHSGRIYEIDIFKDEK